MASIQETFGLNIPAERKQPFTDAAGLQRFERYWSYDAGMFPDVVRFLLDQQPPPSEVVCIGSGAEGYGAILFKLDTRTTQADFGQLAIKAAGELPSDAIMMVNFEEPPVTVSLRMPQAPYNPKLDPKSNTTNTGNLGVMHRVHREPDWLEPEEIAAIPHKH